MSFQRKILAVCFFALMAVPAGAMAQDAAPVKLTTGTWTGIVIPPDGVQEVTYDVTYSGDTLGIVLGAGQHGKFTLNELELTATKLSFSFTPGGTRVVCVLTLNDQGAYGGQCTDDGGLSVPMTMVPPAKDAKAKESGD
jgi:hypothetical protein